MHHGVRTPGSPGFARGQHSARAGLAERLHHSQIRVWKRVRPGERPHRYVLRGPFPDTRQCAQRVERRLDVGVRHESEASVRHRARERDHSAGARAAVGNSVVSEPNGVAIASPNIAAKRPAMVRAAATVTCWPRIARTAVSKPSNAPGTRRPGWRLARAPSACATSAGWQARSINALTRESTGGSALASDAETATRSAGFLGDISTAIQPACSLPSIRMRTV